MKKITPLNDNVLVQPKKPATKTATGIILEVRENSVNQIGTIISVGEDVNSKILKTGVGVIYQQFAGEEVEVDGEKLLLINVSDLWAVYEDKQK